MRLRTGYSFRHAVGKLEDCIQEWDIAEFGEYVPITDRNSTFGWIKWQELCKKKGLHPIFGVEIGVSPDIHAKRPVADYWLFFPKNGDLQALNELVTLSTEQFRYQPLLTYEQACSDNIVSIAGRLTNFTELEEGKILPTGFQYTPGSNKPYLKKVEKLGGELFACSENVYPKEGDRSFYEVVCGKDAKIHTWDQHILKADDFIPDGVQAIENTNRLLKQLYCGDLPQSELPRLKMSKKLPRLCVEGARKLDIDLTDKEYRDRLIRELRMIYEKGYEDYFHIVSDIVRFAKKNMLVGPARGSSAGSLVCYLLGITSIDPLPHSLIFERFIDINRHDMPDIDIDFSDKQRDKVINYIRRKYGKKNVAHLGAVATYQIRSSLQEVGKAYKIPIGDIERLLASIVKRSSGDARANLSILDCLEENEVGIELVKQYPQLKLAAKLEGHPRHCTTHASAIILSNEPISHIVAYDKYKKRLMLDKKDAEKVNLLKLDALGLTQLSTLENTVNRIKNSSKYSLTEMNNVNHYFENLPQVDKAYNCVMNKKYAGIFQFEGVALQSVAKQINISEFKDLEVLSAICRPGPLVSGNTTKWVRRRMKHEDINYPHEFFREFIEDTLGVIIYQEQVMQIGREVGELGWDKVTELRKAMSKSLGKEYFDKFGAPWKAAAIAKGIPENVVNKVWDDMCLSGDCIIENPYPANKDHKYITLKQLYQRKGLGPTNSKRPQSVKKQSILMWNNESLIPAKNLGVFYKGKRQTYTVKTASGKELYCTATHRILCSDMKYRRLSRLKPGDKIMADAGKQISPRKSKKGTGSGRHNWRWKEKAGLPLFKPNQRILQAKYDICQACKEAPYEETHHINMNHEDHRLENLMPVCRKCHKKFHAEAIGYPKAWTRGRGIFADEIISITPRKIEEVYDVEMPEPYHNLLVNQIVVHNCAYGSWAFNKSHSVSYGIISYWCCYMKSHWPLEFAAATLDAEEGNTDKQLKILRELDREGVKYIPFDKKISSDKWEVKDNKLYGPYQNIKGIGPKSVKNLMDARIRGDKVTPALQKKVDHAVTAIDELYPVTAFWKRQDADALRILSKPIQIADITEDMGNTEQLIIANIIKINIRDLNEAIFIARRGYKVDGQTKKLHLQVVDDSGLIFCLVSARNFIELGKDIIRRGEKQIYAIKGMVFVTETFKMIRVTKTRYLGEL